MIAVSLTAVNTFALVPCLHFLGMWPSMVGFLFVVSYLFFIFIFFLMWVFASKIGDVIF